MMSCLTGKKGVALLMVLWVLMLLTVIVGEFCFTMRTRVNITRNFKESTQAYYIAVAGLNKAIEQIIRQEFLPQQVVAVDEETDDDSVPEHTTDWRINTNIAPITFGVGEYEVRIENISGRININLADKPLLLTMFSGFDLEESEKNIIIDSILDWRDADKNHRLNGAEDDYYQSLAEPYDSKDDDFDSPEELLLVRGMTPEIYFRGIENLVTVFPKRKRGLRKQPDKKEFDYKRLNVNAINAEMWTALPGMTEELTAEIMAYRAEKDFNSVSDVRRIIGIDVFRGLSKYLTTQTTSYYKISSTGRISGSRISEGVSALIQVSNQIREKYLIIEWVDEIPVQTRFNGLAV